MYLIFCGSDKGNTTLVEIVGEIRRRAEEDREQARLRHWQDEADRAAAQAERESQNA